MSRTIGLDGKIVWITNRFILLISTSANKGSCTFLLPSLHISTLLDRFHREEGGLRCFTPAVRSVSVVKRLAYCRVD
jgi:hypothetical protein